jgi:hypothetical protein
MTFRHRSIRRAIALLALNLVLGTVALGISQYYTDDREAARDRLSRKLRSLSSERALSEEEGAYLAANQAAYQALVEGGLLDPPDRLAVAAELERLQQAHGLNAIRYSFSPQLARPLGPGSNGGLSVLSTSVTIEMFGITDNDMLAFARALQTDLPGDVRLTELRLHRREVVDNALLARLRAGEAIDLVEGHLAFEWRTLHRADRAKRQDES